ncbi:MarR family winged helix-turn-helix transcriptional regulator [Amycolatopsis sp. QT-25]|uniref:MarR family winged helix-turn-helix transcriptional regulator n=1 Tax=Amycolatopsis sp. QT-25 TaxID=3034022 RepID=UPI0023EBDC91|nr:MarR family winged helix-turn-helix transcriptional regulator [Amycolatopsis sp. QT-25]WET78286.1 MarR family winged helix-turn-helix transcriptional regulator [Amycolatopsis sp. QT-25]
MACCREYTDPATRNRARSPIAAFPSAVGSPSRARRTELPPCHVDRSPDPADGRRNLINLTDPGTRRLDQLESLVSDTQDTFLAPLDPAEREQLTGLLARLVEHHNG